MREHMCKSQRFFPLFWSSAWPSSGAAHASVGDQGTELDQRSLCAGLERKGEEVGARRGTRLCRVPHQVLGVSAQHAAGGAPGLRRPTGGQLLLPKLPGRAPGRLPGALHTHLAGKGAGKSDNAPECKYGLHILRPA